MEIASVVGILFGFFALIVSILISCSFDISGLISFIDYPSLFCVFGGTAASALVAFPLPLVANAMKAVRLVFSPPKVDPTSAITNIIALANLARKEGILALEESVQSMDDAFLKKGIMLIVDGTDPDLTRSIMETELAYIGNRHSGTKGVWEFIGSVGPAWGMIGTLIGLILMLRTLDDPSSIGPSMAVALVTTFYGSVIANFIANPFANKLKVYSDDEELMKEVLIEGMLSIQAGENPRIIEEKLKSFLAPAMRGGGDGGASEAGE